MSFTIFYSEKTPFWAIKTKSSKSEKIDIFPKGLTHGFGLIMAIFSSLLPKKKVGKMAILEPKLLVNPFGKMSIFRLLKLLVFIA